MVTDRLASYFYPRWILMALLSMLGVLALTHIPQEALPRVFAHRLQDKIEHFAAYGLIAAFLILSLRRPVPPLLLLAVLCGLALIGALDEVTQPLVRRHASLMDYASDLAGMAAACCILLLRKRPRLSAPPT
jgi:VanZ family protein